MRSLLLAALAIVLAGSAGAQSRQPPQQPTTQHQRAAADQRDTANQPLFVQVVPADTEQATAAGESQHQQPDWWMIGLTALLTVFTGAQCVFAGQTVLSARAHLRAYMTFDRLNFSSPTIGQPIRYEVFFRNTGQTPALRTIAAHTMALRTIPLKEPFPDIKGHMDENAPSRDLGAGETTELSVTPPDIYTKTDSDLFGSGQAEFYLLGRIEYRDVFKRKRWTTYRYRGVADGALIRWHACEEGNESN